VLKIVFFARVREQLESSGMSLEFDASVASVGGLREQLMQRGEIWQQTLGEDNLICAVNQQVVDDTHRLDDQDEVAFFPPVTGG
jgi:molybdopterin synthase sulfur carrier subunit